jgi:uncharacterized protein (TIGR03118 family)
MRSRSGWFGVLISTAILVSYSLPASAHDASSHDASAHDGSDHGRGVVVRQDNLVSDQPGHAAITDPNLVNAWGMSHGPNTPLWVSDNGADVTTLYRGAVGGMPVAIQPLVVGIPGGAPTGQVFNDTGDFPVPGTGKPALFIFAGEDGDLSAWNQAVSPLTMAISVGHTEGAVYKGLALSHSPFGSLLLAANFHDNRIDVFDAGFHPLVGDELFRDPSLPAGYAPFNVTTIGNHVFVTYAKQDAAGEDDVAGPGHGFIDVFTSSGGFLSRFASRGVLNSPWGMAIAPSSFGAFAGALLVGNFGDGRIHAFDVRTGHLLGTLRNSRHRALTIDGLWGLIVGDPVAGGTQAVWFSAGPDGEAHGLLGILTAG